MQKDKKTEKEESEGNVKSFFKKIESDIVKWFIGTICTLIAVAIPFYFNTINTISAHNSEINDLKINYTVVQESVEKLEKSPVYNGQQISDIKKIVEEIKVKQQKLEDRQDKMYDLMLQIAGKK